jgi:hypothetical protein
MRSGMSDPGASVTGLEIRKASLVVLVAVSAVGCHGASNDSPAVSGLPATAQARSPDNSQSTRPHGDHNPHHGGIVLMKGELHFEVVVDPGGRSHQLFFSDAVRDDLPASFASAASFTLKRPNAPEEVVPLEIDATGESWIGSGKPIADVLRTTVRVAFTVENEPYWIDVQSDTASGGQDTKDTKK